MTTQNNTPTVSLESITNNSKAIEPKDKYMHEHGFPEEHHLPEKITVTRNGITLEYTFTERDRQLSKGKGPPYYMPDMSMPIADLIAHMGDDMAYIALKSYYTTLMQELSALDTKDLWSSDRTRIDDTILVAAIESYTVENETIGNIDEKLNDIYKVKIPEALSGLTSNDPAIRNAAKAKQDELMAEIQRLVIKRGEITLKRKH